jgi:hypothetical protein
VANCHRPATAHRDEFPLWRCAHGSKRTPNTGCSAPPPARLPARTLPLKFQASIICTARQLPPEAGLEVRVLRLPLSRADLAKPQPKIDLDDYCLRHGPHRLQQHIDDAPLLNDYYQSLPRSLCDAARIPPPAAYPTRRARPQRISSPAPVAAPTEQLTLSGRAPTYANRLPPRRSSMEASWSWRIRPVPARATILSRV